MSRMRTIRFVAVAALAVGVVLAGSAGAAQMLEEPPIYGVFYDRYEPSFYTGFAPRGDDPRHVHLHLGRGNQLRVTVVLSDEGLRLYARDLLARRDTYHALVDRGQLALTQNTGLEAFDRALDDVQLMRRVGEEARLTPIELRERNLRLLERLNPGRVFRIDIPIDALVAQWRARVQPADGTRMSRDRQLELLNAMLPTRLWIAELDAGATRDLRALVGSALHPDDTATDASAALRERYVGLLERISGGMYPYRDGRVSFVEFTAIYPVGTFNEFTTYRGRQIPLYPTPGRRALTTHQRTKTVDHIPTVAVYSYSPWLPYMHVGTRLHNSFHTLWWRMRPAATSFLPASWKQSAAAKLDGKPYGYLWLLSRGPMSHGCTHLTTGHIAELRQMLPAETQDLYEVDVFLNKSYHYDVFDIDGDLRPEVMGVHYFIAYSLRNKQPDKLRVRNERRAYYDWLYGGDLRFDPDGTGRFGTIQDGRFIGRHASEGATYQGLPLYEAAYEPERFQLYQMVDIPFARELRKVSVDYPFEGSGSGAIARR